MIQPVALTRKNGNKKTIRRSALPTTRVKSGASSGLLSAEVIADLRDGFESNPAYRVALNAVTQTTADDIALNRAVINNTDFTFSHWLDDWSVTNQRASGRCWMFAGLNLFRVGAMKK